MPLHLFRGQFTDLIDIVSYQYIDWVCAEIVVEFSIRVASSQRGELYFTNLLQLRNNGARARGAQRDNRIHA